MPLNSLETAMDRLSRCAKNSRHFSLATFAVLLSFLVLHYRVTSSGGRDK